MSENPFRPTPKPHRTTLCALAWLLSCSCQSVPPPDVSAAATEEPAGQTATAAPVAPPSSSATSDQTPPSPEANDGVAHADAPKTASPTATAKTDARFTAATKSGANETKPVSDPKATKTDTTDKTTIPGSVTPGKTEAPALEKPCLAKSFRFAAVRSACEKGGVPQAKALMKSWTNKGKAKGESVKCTTCHDNQKTYSNKANADADLRKLLDVIK